MIGLAVGALICAVVIGLVLTGRPIGKIAIYLFQGCVSLALGPPIPESPATAPVYRVVSTDSYCIISPKSMTVKANIPSEAEAPALAEKALELYGGLPDDAVLKKVYRNTMKKYNTVTGIVEEEYPQLTQVIYAQYVDGVPVIGPGAEINIGLGEDGEVLGIEKVWRHLEYSYDVPIISADEAFEKFRRGETLVILQESISASQVTEIRLGYYAEHISVDREYYTPVWIFYLAQWGNDPYPLPVDAVKHI
ncbi:MAG: hypothetical protein EHJ95_03600 [Methanobacteriota archaeon]|nr:MAG: hypothetical protein EHJ95_03600 [Euryarchaeota archaeon]